MSFSLFEHDWKPHVYVILVKTNRVCPNKHTAGITPAAARKRFFAAKMTKFPSNVLLRVTC